jgi:phytol kinase
MRVWVPELPNPITCLWLGPILVSLVLGSGALCGWLKTRRGWRTGDTRKLFHFVIFTAAVVLSLTAGLPGVNLLGGVAAAHVLVIVWLGEGNIFYEGLAREKDRPRRSLYILIPLLSTAAGGMLSTSLFGRFATVGFAVTGIADAIAEPIGIRFGKHRYRVPNFGGGVSSHRSVEGSAAVLVSSFLAAAVVLPVVEGGSREDLVRILGSAVLVAIAATFVEAVSHHGLDNFTVQVAASGAAWAMAAGSFAG